MLILKFFFLVFFFILIINLLFQESAARLVSQKASVTRDLVARLGLEKELKGHEGCVNCLQWSDTGE